MFEDMGTETTAVLYKSAFVCKFYIYKFQIKYEWHFETYLRREQVLFTIQRGGTNITAAG